MGRVERVGRVERMGRVGRDGKRWEAMGSDGKRRGAMGRDGVHMTWIGTKSTSRSVTCESVQSTVIPSPHLKPWIGYTPPRSYCSTKPSRAARDTPHAARCTLRRVRTHTPRNPCSPVCFTVCSLQRHTCASQNRTLPSFPSRRTPTCQSWQFTRVTPRTPRAVRPRTPFLCLTNTLRHPSPHTALHSARDAVLEEQEAAHPHGQGRPLVRV